ncbi:hypothetical protein MsAg5_18370 [Methanosarcinaceae archaeon Ag5]|uniref:S-layer protein n=1 Tax=Methanolapillus africanus TaxID=3028297 RepID=A0AAE4ML23_9EURY|nr:hypothetical protein [Methanosarcinaceae archaeon Ag5]
MIGKNNMDRAGIFALAVLFIILISPAASAASSPYSFLPVMNSDTVDFYQGFGDPELSVSLVGNQEVGKGDSVTLQFAVANTGTLKQVRSIEYVGSAGNISARNLSTLVTVVNGTGEVGYTNASINGNTAVILQSDLLGFNQYNAYYGGMKQFADAERQIEANRVNAQALNINMSCDSPYIEVLTGSDYVYLASLQSGAYNVISAPIRISPNTPAGTYYINMTINYEHPDNARMITSYSKDMQLMNLSTPYLYSDKYVQEYKTNTVTLQIPFVVKSSPVFEVTNIDGMLKNGTTNTIAVTYTNAGDKTAYDTECKIDMMYPLSSASNKRNLGDLAPGESITVEYPITADAKATPKIYGINSDVRYYDENGDLHISPSIKMNVEMEERVTFLTFKNVIIGVIILFVGAMAYDFIKKKKNTNGKENGKESDGDGNKPELSETQQLDGNGPKGGV